MRGRLEDLRTINRESVVFSRNSGQMYRCCSHTYDERETKMNEAHKVIFTYSFAFRIKKRIKEKARRLLDEYKRALGTYLNDFTPVSRYSSDLSLSLLVSSSFFPGQRLDRNRCCRLFFLSAPSIYFYSVLSLVFFCLGCCVFANVAVAADFLLAREDHISNEASTS